MVALCLACSATIATTSTPESPSSAASETGSAADTTDDMPPPTEDAEESEKSTDASTSSTEDSPKAAVPPADDDSRTKAMVAKVINDNRPFFKKCYEDARAKDPALKGNIVLKFLLDAAGKIKKAWIEVDSSSIKNQTVGDCIVQAAKELTYPPSGKGLEKEFKYDFGFNNLPR